MSRLRIEVSERIETLSERIGTSMRSETFVCKNYISRCAPRPSMRDLGLDAHRGSRTALDLDALLGLDAHRDMSRCASETLSMRSETHLGALRDISMRSET
jgi:hypothetical protein